MKNDMASFDCQQFEEKNIYDKNEKKNHNHEFLSDAHTCVLNTPTPLVSHICVSESGQRWFR